MNNKFKVIIEDKNAESDAANQTIDCKNLTEAIREYRRALDSHSQSQIHLIRVMQ